MRLKLYKRVQDMEMAVEQPWYYGHASYDPRMNETVLVIIPFNLLVSVSRWVFFRLRYGLRLDKPLRLAYSKGVEVGFERGRKIGFEQGVDAARR